MVVYQGSCETLNYSECQLPGMQSTAPQVMRSRMSRIEGSDMESQFHQHEDGQLRYRGGVQEATSTKNDPWKLEGTGIDATQLRY